MRHTDFEPPHVLHVPLAQPRPGTPGEGIYLSLWREFSTNRPREWHSIFRTTGPVRQRAASVAASFMVFMGCNGGRGFTWTADRLCEKGVFTNREDAFVAAWAIENKRVYGTNSGLRTSEYMLAEKHPIVGLPVGGTSVDWRLVPDITQEDYDILESMVIWWSTSQAGVMREIAEPMIKAAEHKILSNLFNPEGGEA